MNAIKNSYVKSLQNYQDHGLIKASTWTFRTIRDLRSVSHESKVLTTADRAAIFFRGMVAVLAWLPVNLLAIPYTFILGAIHKNHQKPRPMPQLHEITPGLYLGSDQAAKSKTILKSKEITAVLSILDHDIKVPKSQVSQHLRLEMEDYPDVDIAPVAKRALEFVKEAQRNNQKVLVHCQMGMSRSTSIMTKLVQELSGMSPREALKHVKRQRSVVDLNYGFEQQILRSAH